MYLSIKTSAISIQIKYCWVLTILFIVLNPSSTFAQEQDRNKITLKENLEVNDLVVPNAPASAIIGSQINLKPAITPRAFGFSFLNSIANESGEFPNNIAVEFSPYWWSPRPDLTFEDYYNKNGFGQFIRQSLSFSIASDASTITTDNDDEIDVTKLGVGIRFALIAGRANPQVEEVKAELKNQLQECLGRINQDDETINANSIAAKLNNNDKLEEKDFNWLIETLDIYKNLHNFEVEKKEEFENLIEKIDLINKKQANNKDKKKEVKKVLTNISILLTKLKPDIFTKEIDPNKETQINNFLSEINRPVGNERSAKCVQDNEEIDELNNKLNDLDKARVGLQLETASAVGFDFRENDFDEFRFRNFATWLTASYRSGGSVNDDKASPIKFLGVARYTLDEFEDDTDIFFDIGAGIVYRLQKTPLAFSLEYIRRFGDDGDDRFVGVADYRINDTYSVFLSYGKDFEDESEGNEDLVTLFGVKVGLGRNSTPTVSVPK